MVFPRLQIAGPERASRRRGAVQTVRSPIRRPHEGLPNQSRLSLIYTQRGENNSAGCRELGFKARWGFARVMGGVRGSVLNVCRRLVSDASSIANCQLKVFDGFGLIVRSENSLIARWLSCRPWGFGLLKPEEQLGFEQAKALVHCDDSKKLGDSVVKLVIDLPTRLVAPKSAVHFGQLKSPLTKECDALFRVRAHRRLRFIADCALFSIAISWRQRAIFSCI